MSDKFSEKEPVQDDNGVNVSLYPGDLSHRYSDTTALRELDEEGHLYLEAIEGVPVPVLDLTGGVVEIRKNDPEFQRAMQEAFEKLDAQEIILGSHDGNNIGTAVYSAEDIDASIVDESTKEHAKEHTRFPIALYGDVAGNIRIYDTASLEPCGVTVGTPSLRVEKEEALIEDLLLEKIVHRLETDIGDQLSLEALKNREPSAAELKQEEALAEEVIREILSDEVQGGDVSKRGGPAADRSRQS